MAGKYRQTLLDSMWNSLKLLVTFGRNKPKFVGQDQFGTKYYEKEMQAYSRKTRYSRYFVPSHGKSLHPEDFHDQDIPVEWMAWLRHTRKDPPTEEELNRNQEMAIIKRKNAAKLIESKVDNPNIELPSSYPMSGQRSFPIYEEYQSKKEE